MFEFRPVTAPYPGLRPFEPHEAEIFFGREGHTDRLLEILQRERFLAVVGPSGCGKSSLVRAGLLPGLASGALGTGSDWKLALLRPGAQPLLALAQALLGPYALGRELLGGVVVPQAINEVSAEAALIAAELRRGVPGWLDLLRGAAARRPPGAVPFNLLVLVDQFEELFTYAGTTGDGADEAQAFVDLLLAARAEREFQVFVTLTMRTDFLGECVRFLELPEAINRAQYLTPRLNAVELRWAIIGPARVFGGEMDEAGVQDLIETIRRDSDQLPVLQHALARMWRVAEQEHPDRPWIDGDTVEAVGGVSGALGVHAGEVMDTLTETQRAWAEGLFRAITEWRETGRQEVRHPQSLAVIADWIGAAVDDLKPVVQIFAAPEVSFLHFGRELADNSVIDLTHEALIRQWKQLGQWAENEHWRGEEYREWSERARKAGGRKDMLLDAPDLTRAWAWWNEDIAKLGPGWARRYSRYPDDPFELACEFERTRHFIGKSQEVEERRREECLREYEERVEEERAKKKEQIKIVAKKASEKASDLEWHAANQFIQRLKTKNRVFMASALILAMAVGLVWFGYTRSEQQRVFEKFVLEKFDAELVAASSLAKSREYANAMDYLEQSRQLDADIPVEHRHARNLLAGYVEMMDWRYDPTPPLKDIPPAKLTDLAVSQDGKLLALVGQEGFLALFNTESRNKLWDSKAYADNQDTKDGTLRAVVFDPTGRWLYSAGEDGFISRETFKGDRSTRWKTPGAIQSLALGPDGKKITSGGGDGKISLWSAHDGKPMGSLPSDQRWGEVYGLAFSPDGGLLAAAYGDKTARVWGLDPELKQSSYPVLLSNGHTDKITQVAFGRDGNLLATGGDDGQVTLWKPGNGWLEQSLRGLPGTQVSGIAFSGDGSQLVSGYDDGTLRLWDVESGALQRYGNHPGNIRALAIHDHNVYAIDGDTLRHWSLETPRQGSIKTHSDDPSYNSPPVSVAVAPDGSKLAVGLKEGSLQIFPLPKGQLLGEKPRTPATDENPIVHVEFNAQGDRLATLARNGEIAIWHTEDRDSARWPVFQNDQRQKPRQAVNAIAFAPDGRTLAMAGRAGEIGLLDLDTGQERWSAQAHEAKPVSLAFTPDGKRLLSLGGGPLLLWNIADPDLSSPQEIAQTQKKPTWIAIRPDGRQAAVVGEDQSVELYDLDRPGQPPLRLEGHKKSVSRAIYSPDGHQLATVGDDKTVRLWNLDRLDLLFTLRVPEALENSGPADFDFRCAAATGECWIAVPLSTGRVALYHLPYERMPDGG
ncbi:WD40 repeat [Methylomagnum ishizawai]|uniref:WD40 repeat n=1 Tax=Methylomagnum ishizawai TaxID=1760988 RepID=A0A1Y6CSU4_9GAMM|nr:WD40 repeat domain-containing protein [Methylomagnum ishizawai]SMF93386.1 WD40 repeat [Methylomagnum ishizawai]